MTSLNQPMTPPSLSPALPPVYLGVDVAKAELVLDLQGAIHSFPNTEAGLARLFAHLDRAALPGPAHLVCEASGGYEKLLVAAAWARPHAVSVVVPARVRKYAGALGWRAKNDPLDARLISRFAAATRPPPLTPPEPVRQTLAELFAQRSALLQQKLGADNRAAHQTVPLCLQQHRRLTALLEKEIARLDLEIRRLLAATPALAAADRALQEVAGVGPQTSVALLGLLPELGRINRQQIAALAGLAPYDHDSGARRGQRFIGGGRAPVRKALYMAALAAARCNPVLHPAYLKLRAAGKPAKIALTAIARKLLVHLNSLLAKLHQNIPAKSLAA